jgi:hypothetical protein
MLHGTSAEGMADVHAVLRRDLPLSRNGSPSRSRLGVSDVTAQPRPMIPDNPAASACEVRESVILHGLAESRTLRAENAPRCKTLIFLPSSALRPGRNVRLLSCHRSVGALLPDVTALSFAKLRSDKTRFSISAAHSVQVRCSRYVDSAGVRTLRRVCPVDGSWDAGAAAVAPVVCRSDAGRRTSRRSRSNVAMSGVVGSGRERGHGNNGANDPVRTSI